MKIFNLKELQNARFNRKIKEKVDSYEPELSDSLWHLIADDLDAREQERKKKRSYAWVASLFMIALVGSGIAFFKNNTVSIVSKKQNQVENKQNLFSQNTTAPTAEPNLNTSTIANNNNQIINQNNNGKVIASSAVEPKKSVNYPKEIIPQETTPIPAIDHNTINAKTELLTSSFKVNGQFQAEPASISNFSIPKTPIPVKNAALVSVFIGAEGELANNNLNWKGYYNDNPVAEQDWRKGIESSTLTSSGKLFTGIEFKNFILQSGLAFRNYQTQMSYDVKDLNETPQSNIIPGIYSIITRNDTMVQGNKYTRKNYIRVIEVPLELAYRIKLNNKFSVLLQTGVSYNFIRNYELNMSNKDLSYCKVQNTDHQVLRNYFSANAGIMLAYSLGDRLSITAGFNHRFALNNTYKNGININPSATGFNTGLRFRLR